MAETGRAFSDTTPPIDRTGVPLRSVFSPTRLARSHFPPSSLQPNAPAVCSDQPSGLVSNRQQDSSHVFGLPPPPNSCIFLPLHDRSYVQFGGDRKGLLRHYTPIDRTRVPLRPMFESTRWTCSYFLSSLSPNAPTACSYRPLASRHLRRPDSSHVLGPPASPNSYAFLPLHDRS